MTIEPVLGVIDAMHMRSIRNQCRMFMTRDISWIGVARQLKWYYGKYKRLNKGGYIEAWLVRDDGRSIGHGHAAEGKPIGWGYIKKDEMERPWVAGGLLEEYRGRGYGRKLFDFLTNRAVIMRGESWLEVYDWNAPALKLYLSLGYKEIKTKDDVMIMRMGRGTL